MQKPIEIQLGEALRARGLKLAWATMTPPELAADIIDRGVAPGGGTALLKGLDKYLTLTLGIPVYVVDNPVTCTVEGTAKAFDLLDVILRGQQG